MIDSWMKIDDSCFDVNIISTQLSIGSHANLNISLNTIKNPDCYGFFTNWFDSSSIRTGYASQYKKDISCKNFDSKGCFIKAIDFDPNTNTLSVDVSCDYLQTANVSERRDSKIDELLNETYNKKTI
jgi:hypothetical protein